MLEQGNPAVFTQGVSRSPPLCRRAAGGGGLDGGLSARLCGDQARRSYRRLSPRALSARPRCICPRQRRADTAGWAAARLWP